MLPAAVALLGAILFAITLRGHYLYDDVPLLIEDPRVTQTGHFSLIWSRDYHFDLRTGEGSVDNLYRPLVTTSFHLQIAYFDAGPFAIRLVNLLLYAVVCGLVAWLGYLLGGWSVGIVAGVFFAVHPVHVEVLATAVGRAELMSAAGLLAALGLYLARPLTHGRALAIVSLGVVAMLSKEQGLLLPLVLLAAEPFRRGRMARLAACESPGRQSAVGPGRGTRVTPLQTLMLGVCLSVAAYIVLREQVLGLKFAWDRGFLDPAVQPMVWSSGPDRWLMPLVLLGQAVYVLLLPLTLSLDYSGAALGSSVSASDIRLYLGVAAALGGMLAFVWSVRRRRWDTLLALAGFTSTWAMVGNIVSLIGVNFADRLMFLPSAFLALLVGIVWPGRYAGRVVLAVWIGLLALQTIRYAVAWSRPPLEVYAWTLERNPKSYRLYQLLADAQLKSGDAEAAAQTMARGIATFPHYFAGYLQAGLIAERRGRWDEAEAFYVQAAQIDPQRAAGALLEFRARRAAVEPATQAATRPTSPPPPTPSPEAGPSPAPRP